MSTNNSFQHLVFQKNNIQIVKEPNRTRGDSGVLHECLMVNTWVLDFIFSKDIIKKIDLRYVFCVIFLICCFEFDKVFIQNFIEANKKNVTVAISFNLTLYRQYRWLSILK